MRTPLELRHLHTLRMLRSTGSLSRAAQGLCLTQSALSHQIKALESFFGCALFVRKSSPLRFTPAGKRLLELAETVIPAAEEAERDIARLAAGAGGSLRITVECHTCFDWLMPSMDAFRQRWPDVDLDIVSGFHPDSIGLLHEDRADLAIIAVPDPDEAVDYHPLFRFQIVGLLANDHPLLVRDRLAAADFRDETLITYPVPDEMLDVLRQVLTPAGVAPKRRTAELTIAILQLVASRRGLAALPLWAVAPYLERGYVSARPIGDPPLVGELYAATLPSFTQRPFVADFVAVMRETCLATLPGIDLL
ncbi:LysR family transcriptional regulator, regulator for metE and metH [Chitinasiproducens palmae]|uniref:HTH-type transcriptional regulator MetR n=2 Tax=Chitinasiproducens palmae TaxID=1770053 RepID=A0A1H2PVX6_9BURK|nr:LysR family transcriptional regulator, regulator for metE and metH [Chitinasiproducens palmae]